MNVMNIAYDSTNYYLVQANNGWIMIDIGWAGTCAKLLHLLKQKGISIHDIRHLVVTHFHPDHAGLVQDMKEQGTILLLHTCQVPSVGKLGSLFKPQHHFKEIQAQGNLVLSTAQSRTFLNGLGMAGEIVPTPGHSDDSVSLVIDGVCAFTGDLPSPLSVDPDADSQVKDSWRRLQTYGVKTIFPGHGSSFRL